MSDHNIKSIEQIEREARAAAKQYTNLDEACPYSFYTEAGRTFKRAFQQERLAMGSSKTTATKATT